MMVKQQYTVSFVTPAFLGDAEQNGAWRTPPFKALLRQWWRVAAVEEYNYDHARLRETEGRLFGNAWIEPINGKSQFCKSRVLLRLGSWSKGGLASDKWPGGSVEDVVTTRDGKGRVRADVYMGYGPVMPPSKKENRPRITIRNAISADDSRKLCLSFDQNSNDTFFSTLQLIQWFGCLGSRSRNGWGSLLLESAQENTPDLSVLPQADNAILNRICLPWKRCLEKDWPHALGTDSDKPLIWITERKADWRKVIGCLANIKVEVRFAAKALQGPAGIGGIHLLGYPAGGKWELKKLGAEARLANQLRFKVLKIGEGFMGIISHFPCKFPDELKLKLDDKQRDWIDRNEHLVWEKIHSSLRNNKRLKPLF
ncbi:MAG: hypothetical protein JNK95_04580 [Candidatus Competibacter sp.]|nr:hypothetical protein [Candidatus Competibacter sp.]MDG4605629.1 hypothetical protein [Candidatus Contendobacter sp.]HRD50422.1 hypothetical protein [Candidatus Contendobacter sp.]